MRNDPAVGCGVLDAPCQRNDTPHRVVEDADPYGGLHQRNAPVFRNVRVVGDACGFSPALYMEKRFFTMVLPIASACGIISP